MQHRFAIRRDAWFRPLLWLFGGVTSKSYVELDSGRLRVRFGPLFDNTFSLGDIESAQLSRWPLLFGLGWRTDLRGRIALVGSYGGLVEIRLREKRRLRSILPFWLLRCDRIVVSLEEPDAFLVAIQTDLAAAG